MVIKRYTKDIKFEWDKYVEKNRNSNLFQMTPWKEIVEKTFNLISHYLYAENGGKIVGVLPLFCVKNILMKKVFISVPFAVYGGACTDNHEIEKKLLVAAESMTIENKAAYLELRYMNERKKAEIEVKPLYHCFIMKLQEDPNLCWTNMRKKARNIIRKGMKANLEIREDPDDIEGFYNLFSTSQQNLGTPVLPRYLFSNIMNIYGRKNVTIFSTFSNGKKINSLMTFFFKDIVMPYYLGYSKDYLQYSPNNFILWKLIEFGCKNKYKYYDVGRSRINSGSYSFKKNLGITPKPLHYQYFLNLDKKIPNINPSNKKFEVAQYTWQKMPVSIANVLGPKLIKYFP